MFFLIGTVSVITSWGGMFFSHTFRLLFVTWGFFAMVAVIAMVLSGVTLVLGIACRLGFGKNAKTLSSYCTFFIILFPRFFALIDTLYK